METMTRKTIELGKVDGYGNGRKSCMADVEVKITDRNGYPELSICGNIWNNLHTDIIRGGQCLDTILTYFPRNPKVKRIVEVWEKWHLNGMKAGTPAQMAIVKEAAPNFAGYPASYYDQACVALDQAGLLYDPDGPHEEGTPGYKYGSAWLREELPAEIIAEVRSW